MSDPPDLLRRNRRFCDIRYIGSGSMGAVYRAFDGELGTTIAIKTILDAGPDLIFRLKQEFRSLRGVAHRNLVQLHDLVVTDEACFFTMEYVDGVDFTEFVRGGRDPTVAASLVRSIDAAPQLVLGVRALHAADRMHRDIKPSNIKVDDTGRVVLLDFDLATPIDRRLPTDVGSSDFAGTFAYMAPEQRSGLPATPAADWYAVGVVLYESLTGSLPAAEDERARRFERDGIVPLRARIPDAPVWLAEVIEALLSKDPEDRPDGDEVFECFEAGRAPRFHYAAGSAGANDPPVGRAHELERLDAIYRKDGTAIVTVHGGSGVGKTELVRTFLASRDDDPPPALLEGRCNPQESVTYPALDPIVDGLSRLVLEQRAALPEFHGREAAALIKLFPVLARIPALATEAHGVEIPDVFEARRLGTRALRRLLKHAATNKRLVLWLDDVQWSDVDSGTLLGELLRPPDAPPLLLVLAYRREDRDDIALLGVLEELGARFPELAPHEIGVEPLDPFNAAALAGRLSAKSPLPPEQLEAIVSESEGSPFLIHEMVKRLQDRGKRGTEGVEPIDLSNVVRDRLHELEPDERTLLEFVSLCGQPTERSLLLSAAGMSRSGLPSIARLENRSLIRIQVHGQEHAVQAYHDRIREAIATDLSAECRALHHAALARVFESSGRVEPAVLAHHFQGAGLSAQAGAYAIAAGEKAANALAFRRAAELYRSAREWDPRTADWQRSLQTREAECLANASHLTEAGRLFLAASVGAPTRESLELRRRASEHLLAGGNVEEGMATLETLLGELEIPLPASPRSATLRSAWKLVKILARRLEPRRGGPLEEEARIRIDTCYGTGKSLMDMDSLLGSYFTIVGLENALASGDLYRTARSLGFVGGLVSLIEPLRERGRTMMERARKLAEDLDAPELLGTLAVAEGQGLMLRGHWREALERSEYGVRLLSEECRGFAFECNIGRGNALRTLEEIGEDIPEIGARARQLREAAAAAANLYAETAAVQHLSFASLAIGDVTEARRLADRGLALWDREGFHIQHLYTAKAAALCDLYEGRPDESCERFHEIVSALRSSNLMRVPLVRVDVHHLNGRLALASAMRTAIDREARLRQCERNARQLDRESRPDARAHASLLRAGIETLRRNEEAAIPHIDAAISACDGGAMPLRSACALLFKGDLLRGDEGRACVERATRRMEAFGVEEPRRWAEMYALGLDATRVA